MNYGQFISAIKWTEAKWSLARAKSRLPPHSNYASLRARGNSYWLHLENMTKQELSKGIITGFLNTKEWNCHINNPTSPEGKAIISNLALAVQKLKNYYAALVNFQLESIDFQGTCNPNSSGVPILPVIGEIYYTFCSITPRFGPVPASKLMHMALPELFMLWDDSIIKGYRVPSYPSDKPNYLTFLILMQENINHIKATYPGNGYIGTNNLLRQINAQFGYSGVPMTRLLDIANYAVGHPEMGAPLIRCNQCYHNTNAKLKNIGTYLKVNYGIDTALSHYK